MSDVKISALTSGGGFTESAGKQEVNKPKSLYKPSREV